MVDRKILEGTWLIKEKSSGIIYKVISISSNNSLVICKEGIDTTIDFDTVDKDFEVITEEFDFSKLAGSLNSYLGSCIEAKNVFCALARRLDPDGYFKLYDIVRFVKPHPHFSWIRETYDISSYRFIIVNIIAGDNPLLKWVQLVYFNERIYNQIKNNTFNINSVRDGVIELPMHLDRFSPDDAYNCLCKLTGLY